ncbi:MAG: glycosyltransferase family 9 protein [Pyrinomonadaceae bacterium]
MPAFWAVRKTFPDAQLTLLTNTDVKNPNYIAAQQVLPGKNLFDATINYPSGVSKFSSPGSFYRLWREIRSGKFDAAVYLMTRNRSIRQIQRDVFFFRLAGIRKVFGVDYLKKNIVDAEKMVSQTKTDREGDFLLESLWMDGFPIKTGTDFFPELLLTPEEKRFALDWLKKKTREGGKTPVFIGVAPGSKWESKVWEEGRFARVVAELIREKNVFPIVFGGREDKEKGDRLVAVWKRGCNAAGELNIRQAAAALENCRLYLGNDTGTMHLAASVGVRCVAIFAAIDLPGRWEPNGDGHRIFRRRVECAGCLTPVCFNRNKCLDLVGVGEVAEACLEILEGKN